MAAIRTASLATLAAWPLDLLLSAGGQPCGFLMPRVTGHKTIHTLYTPKSRKNDFPEADWKFLIRSATNVARAVAIVHEHGCVIGDINHGSILVSPKATVKLIDCESFQVVAQGRRFLWQVGVPTYTPPELQGRSFNQVVRTDNHDAFGLAVLIFHLLLMGRHPFAGRFVGGGEMPMERAISEFRFAYGANRQLLHMQPPPHALPLEAASEPVAQLFERAFSREGVRDGIRPSATYENAARAHFEQLRWPNGPVCAHCGSIDSATELNGKSTRPGVFKCLGCRKPFMATIGTLYERSHIPLHKWLLATHLMCASKKGMSAHQLLPDARVRLLPNRVVHGASHPRGHARASSRGQRSAPRREQGG